MGIDNFPIGRGVAVTHAIHWFIAGYAERRIDLTAVICGGVADCDIHQPVIRRPQGRLINTRAANHGWRVVDYRHRLLS